MKKTKRTSASGPRWRKQGNNEASPWNLRRLLVPLDFSGQSRQALELAVPLARQYGGKILLLHVVQPPAALEAIPGSGQYLIPMDRENLVRMAQVRLKEMAAKLVPSRLLERVLVRQGSPYYEITSAARTLKIDLIVIATHGHSGLKRMLIGSTAERVVRHATCPVLVVRRR